MQLPEVATSSISTRALHLIEEIAAHLGSISPHRSEAFDIRLHLLLENLNQLVSQAPGEEHILRRQFLALTEPILSRSTVTDHGRKKPLGYAGDFRIIDWTYLEHVGERDAVGALLDEFYHDQVAPKAVRDRKQRFGSILRDAASQAAARPLRILNVGSGSGREIVDGAAHAELEPRDLRVFCVEIDARAIDHAKALLGAEWEGSVEFWKGNAIKYRPNGKFDLIWSAGLFDYLNDRLAVSLLKRLWPAVAPTGRLVIGNFADTHPTRQWIEWCGDWFLIHRSLAELKALAAAAGIPASAVSTYSDQWGAVGFLDATKAA